MGPPNPASMREHRGKLDPLNSPPIHTPLPPHPFQPSPSHRVPTQETEKDREHEKDKERREVSVQLCFPHEWSRPPTEPGITRGDQL